MRMRAEKHLETSLLTWGQDFQLLKEKQRALFRFGDNSEYKDKYAHTTNPVSKERQKGTLSCVQCQLKC